MIDKWINWLHWSAVESHQGWKGERGGDASPSNYEP